jgi:LacI family transcriptional regulator
MPTRAGGASAIPGLLDQADPPTAALCFNDVVAIGVIRGLTAAGRTVGRDFAVIGFDDIEDARHMVPGLTSVAVAGQSLGERAAQLLMSQIASGVIVAETQLGPADLVIRASCGTSAPSGAIQR